MELSDYDIHIDLYTYGFAIKQDDVPVPPIEWHTSANNEAEDSGPDQKRVLGVLLDEDGNTVYDEKGGVVRVTAPNTNDILNYEEWHGSDAWKEVIAFYAEMKRAKGLNEMMERMDIWKP